MLTRDKNSLHSMAAGSSVPKAHVKKNRVGLGYGSSSEILKFHAYF